MELLYKSEHLSCFNYEKSNKPAIERVEIKEGEEFHFFNDVNKLFFFLKGEVSVSFDKYVNKKVKEGDFFLIPVNAKYHGMANKHSSILLFRLHSNLNFCDHFSFEMLCQKDKNQASNIFKFVPLEMNAILKSYMEVMDNFLKDGLKCSYLFELKLKELLFLLRAYYTKEDLSILFSSILTKDLSFSNKVYEYCDKTKSSKEMAELMNYSLSGFEKRFKRIFGVPAYQWMKMRKAKSIYHEINCTKKTFSEIGFEYGFSSSSYFNDFCKANFGKTPGEIRKMKLQLNQLKE